jgi:hypothetical protein
LVSKSGQNFKGLSHQIPEILPQIRYLSRIAKIRKFKELQQQQIFSFCPKILENTDFIFEQHVFIRFL